MLESTAQSEVFTMFNGFSKETSEFMWELAFNNERPWFNAHKQEFETYLNNPFRALASDTYAILSERFTGLDFRVHVSRIYRDARRLFGRGPYKEALWFTISLDQFSSDPDNNGPAFWFEIKASSYAYGMGYYGYPAQMECYRSTIDANPAAFERLAEQMASLPGLRLEGEDYKRPKALKTGYTAGWYNKKYFSLAAHGDFGGDLLSPDLPGILADAFGSMMPMFLFLSKISEREK